MQHTSTTVSISKNCEQWAVYESAGTSETAKLCHGGYYEGTKMDACPARLECKKATMEATRAEEEQERRRLPLFNPQRPAIATQNTVPSFRSTAPTPVSQRTLFSQQQPQQLRAAEERYFPRPVIPPQDYPTPMRTAYASPAPVGAGGISPTFLPEEGEGVFQRLTKNAVQGMVAAVGWHVFDFTRTVDLFKR